MIANANAKFDRYDELVVYLRPLSTLLLNHTIIDLKGAVPQGRLSIFMPDKWLDNCIPGHLSSLEQSCWWQCISQDSPIHERYRPICFHASPLTLYTTPFIPTSSSKFHQNKHFHSTQFTTSAHQRHQIPITPTSTHQDISQILPSYPSVHLKPHKQYDHGVCTRIPELTTIMKHTKQENKPKSHG